MYVHTTVHKNQFYKIETKNVYIQTTEHTKNEFFIHQENHECQNTNHILYQDAMLVSLILL